MGKRGPKPRGEVNTSWSSDFSYALGLLASDGCLYNDGRHISLVSKDKEQIENFLFALKIKKRISLHHSGAGKLSWRAQFSDAAFYEFLLSIGVSPHKSLTIGRLKISEEYFFDFLRGIFDGDGSIYSYYDKRWKSSFMFYVSFASASREFIRWIREMIGSRLGLIGHVTYLTKGNGCYQLRYAKAESLVILNAMYYNPCVISLSRKRLKVQAILAKSINKDLLTN